MKIGFVISNMLFTSSNAAPTSIVKSRSKFAGMYLRTDIR